MDGIEGQTIHMENEKLNRINELARLAKERKLSRRDLCEHGFDGQVYAHAVSDALGIRQVFPSVPSLP